ncbi:hypothetical protein SCHPADRAFT_1001431 [Schizopora paradoxa]|uniref:BTB domain-containing protein n=1 Tax=Schizopora paradoxa TaxID=27342 RepID=A0A0H2R799_9AGAM|nr:hypothetical protein SCHPADRAFT_1001431 [Schizopora paradoxa]
MSPPPKRARTSSSTEDEAAAEAEDHPKLKQHETLWFEDGNIVLATDVHLYCVHRGVLARNSTVFKDMLELPNVGNAWNNEMESAVVEDSWEGKPKVRMVGDNDEDVYLLLMVLYDVGFYSDHKPTTLPTILSLLRMSTKYDFSRIRSEVTSHLERAYPRELDAMGERNFEDLFLNYDDLSSDYDLQLLVVAEQCNLKSILPVLYLDCVTSPMDTILQASRDLRLKNHQIEKLLRGHERMVRYAHEYGIIQFAPQQYCTMSCTKARGELLQNYVIVPQEYPVQALLEEEVPNDDDDARLRKAICKTCAKTISASLKEFRLQVWNSIPDLFDLGTWEDVRRD